MGSKVKVIDNIFRYCTFLMEAYRSDHLVTFKCGNRAGEMYAGIVCERIILHQIADIQAAKARVEHLIHLIIPLYRTHSARGIDYFCWYHCSACKTFAISRPGLVYRSAAVVIDVSTRTYWNNWILIVYTDILILHSHEPAYRQVVNLLRYYKKCRFSLAAFTWLCSVTEER